MVFASICEHASSAFIFASTSSDQFSDASSKHFVNSVSASWNLFFTLRNLADTFKKGKCDRHKARQHDNYVLIAVQPFPVAYSQLCLV